MADVRPSRIFASGLAVASALTIVFAVAIYLREVIKDNPADLLSIFVWQLGVWLPWIVFVPLLWGLEILLRGQGWPLLQRFGAHALLALTIAVAHGSWTHLVSERTSPFVDDPATRYGVFKMMTLNWSLIDSLVYALVLVVLASRAQAREGAELSGPPAAGDSRVNGAATKDVFIRTDGGAARIRIEDLVWVEAQDYYAMLHTRDRGLLSRISLSKLERQLDPEHFVRVHRSALVNVDHVERLERDGPGRWRVVLTGGAEAPVSRSGYQRLSSATGLAALS